ncbi:hypothetical protein CFO_g3201 [Ceratocystis platani]|uniref:Transmembrane protein n=1 Tax=Ceratocystis fimbriata f. sp. platani TaxID=88771 RepID=A0A0F8B385_CERFI|nr:hypothetical protein CFO_g3201 [Ceratocystis platani]
MRTNSAARLLVAALLGCVIGGNGSGQTLITTINGVVTTEYLAPFRPTATASASATSTGDSDESNDDDDDDGGSSLSAAGIFGIVFGTLVGIAILGALCFFCFARGLWASVFGGRTNNSHGSNSNIEVYEEYQSDSDYYSRAGTSAMAAGAGRRRGRGDSWHGEKPRKKKSGAGWFGLGAVAATLLAMLNMKKDKKTSRESEAMYSRPYGSETLVLAPAVRALALLRLVVVALVTPPTLPA